MLWCGKIFGAVLLTSEEKMAEGNDKRGNEQLDMEEMKGLGGKLGGRVKSRGGYFGALSTAAQIAALKSNDDAAHWIDLISPREFHYAFNQLYQFFCARDFIQVPTQHRLRPPLGRLAACENPHNIVPITFLGKRVPLPQTGQMWLEEELLTDPRAPGYFCVSYSYRDEKEPQLGRHNFIFPMFEFEMHGSISALQALEKDLIAYLGIRDIFYAFYEDTARKYGVREIGDAEEKRLWAEHGPAVLLMYFPEHTSPFWNMKRVVPSGDAAKIDGILFGVETIGSAERSCDPADMWNRFHTISDGKYAEKLFELFGEKEIHTELNYFLSHKFFPRSGGGIGMTRLIRALKLAKKL